MTDVFTLDRTLQIVGIVLAGIAALFSFLEWRARRKRAALELTAEARHIPKAENEQGGNVAVVVTIENTGEGPAADWRVTLVSKGGPIAGDIDPSPEWRVVDPWNLEWSSRGADDTIGVGMRRQASFVTSRLAPGEGIGILFALSARRMKKATRAGSFHVIVDEADEAGIVYGPVV
jgi:hypothetical protein